MRFTVEIYAVGMDNAEIVLHRTSANTINPAGARKEARRLLTAWNKRRANGVRVINGAGQAIYSWNE